MRNSKRLIILITEIAVVFLMSVGLFPCEAGLFLTGLLVFYFIFEPLKDSLWIFVASIPLFVALPISENFDSMANWRILLSVLFLVLFFKSGVSLKFTKIEYLIGVFLIIGVISLFVATDIVVGIKKLLFLINIFLLYAIIRNLIAKDKKVIKELKSALKIAIGITLSVGYLQLIIIFFVRLFPFWQFWAKKVIPVFYGMDLSHLLSYSNTWFSYYSYQLPTLRMFSVFPDSHSFAFFCILSLPFFLAPVFLKTARYYLLLIIPLLAIIFSGSRGAWVSAIGIFFIFLILYFLQIKKKSKKQFQLILGSLIIFFVLFPIGSAILFLPQYIQLGQEAISGVSFFERARTIIDFSEISVRSRLEIWERTMDSILINPALGVGIGNFPVVLKENFSSLKRGASAHSLYLDVAAEMGIFALIVLLTIFWLILKDTWRVFIRTKPHFFRIFSGFFLLVLIWILGYNLFDVVLLNDKVLLFFIANLALLYSIKYATE